MDKSKKFMMIFEYVTYLQAFNFFTYSTYDLSALSPESLLHLDIKSKKWVQSLADSDIQLQCQLLQGRGRDATYHSISRDVYLRSLSKYIRN